MVSEVADGDHVTAWIVVGVVTVAALVRLGCVSLRATRKASAFAAASASFRIACLELDSKILRLTNAFQSSREIRARYAFLLRETRAKLSIGWTQGALARDERGMPVDPNSTAAVCWCFDGALATAASGVDEHFGVCLVASNFTLYNGTTASHNDRIGTSKMDMLELCDKAIVLAESEAA